MLFGIFFLSVVTKRVLESWLEVRFFLIVGCIEDELLFLFLGRFCFA